MFQSKEIHYKGIEVLSLLGVATFLTIIIALFVG